MRIKRKSEKKQFEYKPERLSLLLGQPIQQLKKLPFTMFCFWFNNIIYA